MFYILLWKTWRTEAPPDKQANTKKNEHNCVVSFIWKQVTHDNHYLYINFIYFGNREGNKDPVFSKEFHQQY